MQKAVSLGFAVAKPWGDSERYDYILDAGGRFWRVQVEASCGRERRREPAAEIPSLSRDLRSTAYEPSPAVHTCITRSASGRTYRRRHRLHRRLHRAARALVRAPGRVLLALQKLVVLSQRQQKRIALRKLPRSLVAAGSEPETRVRGAAALGRTAAPAPSSDSNVLRAMLLCWLYKPITPPPTPATSAGRA